jgi:hypothetical protein
MEERRERRGNRESGGSCLLTWSPKDPSAAKERRYYFSAEYWKSKRLNEKEKAVEMVMRKRNALGWTGGPPKEPTALFVGTEIQRK